MNNSGLNMEIVKDHNRALIIQLICTNNGVTRQDLTEATNLTPMTLTNITSELIKNNLICEIDAKNTGKGRTPKLLYPAPNSPVAAGIFISKTCMYGIITDLSLNIIITKKVPFARQETSDTITTKLLTLADYLTSYSDRPLLGLGVSTVGVVDTINGRITYITDFFNIHELEIKSILERHVDIPVFVKNDMQSAALCEMYFGLGKVKDHFIYLGLTIGVGASIVANQQLLNNMTGSCGELGHMTINYKDGEQCQCGSRGCLELTASVPKIIEHINQACNTNFSDFREALAFCDNNDTARAILMDVSDQLAYALNNLINIVDISTIILGHSAIYLPDYVLDSIEKRLNRISLFRYNRTIKIFKSRFEDNGPLLGSACNVLDQLFSGMLSQ